MLLTGGETLSLGGDVTVSARHVPGHTAGSVAYVVDGQDSVFVGDAVQIHGAANGFPGYEDPGAYRSSLRYLRDSVRPQHLGTGTAAVTDDVDPDVAAWPNLVHLLHYPKNHEAWFDIVMNELDGDWYEERNPVNLAENIEIRCVMTLILMVVENAVLDRMRRAAPGHDALERSATRGEAHR